MVYLRGYANGKPFREKIDYEPYMFVPSETGEYTTLLTNLPMKKKMFTSIRQAKEYVQQKKEIAGFELHGNENYLYQFLNDEFSGEVEFDPDLIKVVSIDIETSSKGGWPNIQTADKDITAISLSSRGKRIVLGTKPYTVKANNVTYIMCKDEPDLLRKFIDVWLSDEWLPDVVTGWNIEMFDIPYIVRRIKRVLSESDMKDLSPWRIVEDRKVMFGRGQEKELFDIFGVVIIDYLPLYKKFALKKAESYALDFIAKIELEQKKLDYREHGYTSLDDLYERNFEMYIDYNIHDAVLVDMLEDKLGFIQQVFTLAYDAKTNYMDVFGTVRPWDVMITNFLLNERKVVVPLLHPPQGISEQIIGGYVKDPDPKRYTWIVSFDLTSLYPHLIMMFNISPETFLLKIDDWPSIQEQINGLPDKIYQNLLKHNACVTGNGCVFSREQQGFLPHLMQKMFNDRAKYKKIMIDTKKELELTTDPQEREKLKKKIVRYDNLQNAKKIQLNSAYGALANQYYRFFNRDLAEAVTSSGQRTTMFTEMMINRYLNKILETESIDYVLACDTDSVYITLDPLITKLSLSDRPKLEIVDFIDDICKNKIEPYFDRSYETLAKMTNAFQQKMRMKREAIADTGIWTAKKHYILNVYDNEGVRFKEPEIKLVGIEAVRSSTPLVVRGKIKEAMKIALREDELSLQVFINKFREEFLQMEFGDVAFPRTCNGLEKYSDDANIYGSKCPPQVKGALLYNHFITQRELDSKYPVIREGTKIRFAYLKMPNPFKDTVISVPDELPPELDMDRFIDRKLQFEKTFLIPITRIIDVMGWSTAKVATLEGILF
jgi:DNA polymerase elongation subunit (family B)